MSYKIFKVALFAFIVTACNPYKNETESHEEHTDVKIQFTAYSNEFELFAEADAFVVGKTSNVLSHFSTLPNFKALETGVITIHLIINGKETSQILDKPTRKGIYSFDLKPETTGTGHILFDIKTETGNFQLTTPPLTVFASEEEADKDSENRVLPKTNTTVFTKEQTWKIDYESALPLIEPFGQVIKTTALVQSAKGDEIIISAKTSGIIMLSSTHVLEGTDVASGQVLFTISGNEFTDNNAAVRFAEAKNNLERAKAEYDRAQELAKDKIVSEKDLLNAKIQYSNAKTTFDNLNKNFSANGQKVISPISGFVKELFVENGQYVEAGNSIASISQNKKLLLIAEVQQKYAALLGSIYSANIRTLHNNQTYGFEQVNGKIVSYGKSANSSNYLIPVTIQIDNMGSFTAGGFVEIYLKTLTNAQALTIPNTALMEEQGNFFVYVQLTPELFEKREVRMGGNDGLKTEIITGITSTERIVTKGAVLIKLAQATGTLDAHSGHVH